MKLTKVRVELFENIVDSTDVEMERDVTCLVGKNESGKTAFLRALSRLNPAYEQGSKFVPRDDYPRWRWRRDEKEKRVEGAKPICATFQLSDDDVAAVGEAFGSGALASRDLRAWRTYANELFLEVDATKLPSFSTSSVSCRRGTRRVAGWPRRRRWSCFRVP